MNKYMVSKQFPYQMNELRGDLSMHYSRVIWKLNCCIFTYHDLGYGDGQNHHHDCDTVPFYLFFPCLCGLCDGDHSPCPYSFCGPSLCLGLSPSHNLSLYPGPCPSPCPCLCSLTTLFHSHVNHTAIKQRNK